MRDFLCNSGSYERLLQIQEMILDPMEPPRHKILKVPLGSLTEPVPVMHSPPNGVDYREAMNWKIPPALSNWKNSKGYIIPLDKRLAVDGRILQETKINDNFAKLSEALYIADRKAREETELRNWVAKENLMQQKERKNAEMRALALNAKFDKVCGHSTISASSRKLDELKIDSKTYNEFCLNSKIDNNNFHQFTFGKQRNMIVDRKHQKGRDDIRKRNKNIRERERRLVDAGEHGYRRSKITRDFDRDVNERIALGMNKSNQQTFGYEDFRSQCVDGVIYMK